MSDSAPGDLPITVPVIRSTFDPVALAREVEQAYDLETVRLQLIKGTFRDTYRMESASGPRIVSVYRHGLRSTEEIEAELDILAYLDAQGIPVAPAVPRQNGAMTLRLAAPEGERIAALFRYQPGEQLGKTPDPVATFAYGSAIARIHLSTDKLPQPMSRPILTPATLLERPIDTLAAVLGPGHGCVAELRAAAERLLPHLHSLPRTAPAYGLIHGDVIPSNAQVGPDGQITVLDFDFCAYGWRALDVATYLMESAYWNTPARAREAFQTGYASVRPLAPAEVDALPVLEATRAIASLGTPAGQVNVWGSAYLSDAMIERTLAIVRDRLAYLG